MPVVRIMESISCSPSGPLLNSWLRCRIICSASSFWDAIALQPDLCGGEIDVTGWRIHRINVGAGLPVTVVFALTLVFFDSCYPYDQLVYLSLFVDQHARRVAESLAGDGEVAATAVITSIASSLLGSSLIFSFRPPVVLPRQNSFKPVPDGLTSQ